MNNKEAKYIIDNYKPCEGFFNLSVKPNKLNNIAYAKILNMQAIVIEENRRMNIYLQPDNWHKCRLQDLQELSAQLQQIILKYWKLEEI